MKKLLPQLHLHGLSTGDFQESFGWLFSEDAPLSPSMIVRLKQQWEEEYKKLETLRTNGVIRAEYIKGLKNLSTNSKIQF